MSKKKDYNNSGSKVDDDAEKQRSEYDYCKVCRLNHNPGRRHNFFPNHKKALSSLLSRFQAKVKNDVAIHLKNPTPLGPEHQRDSSLNRDGDRLWCVFCDSDVVEFSSSFARENAIEHLASVEHLKQLKRFLWKYGGGMDRLDSFRISESDFVKWEKKCKLLKTEAVDEGSYGSLFGPLNDIQTQAKSDYIERYENNNSLHSLNFDNKFPNGVVPLQNHTNERSQILYSEMSRVTVDEPQVHHTYMGTDIGVGNPAPKSFSGSFGYQHSHFHPKEHQTNSCTVNGSMYRYDRIATGETYSQDTSTGLVGLTQVSASAQSGSEGNVHTGAPPPWFTASESVKLDNNSSPGLSRRRIELAKSSKLNPKRVGAAWAERRKIELELQKRGELENWSSSDADWLPNFGRVWQSGSRKESRKEFKGENKTSRKVDNQMDNISQLKPYISKRMVSLPLASGKETEKEFMREHKTSIEVDDQTDNTSQLEPYISKRTRRDAIE